jgi:hypothetical protein
LGKISEEESLAFIDRVLQALFDRQPDDGLRFDLDVAAPDGTIVTIRNPAPAVSGAAN